MQPSQPNPAYLAQRFAKERLKARLLGFCITLATIAVMGYMFTRPIILLGKITVLFPLLIAGGISQMITAMNKAECMFLYQKPHRPWHATPLISKILLIIGGLLSFLVAIVIIIYK